MYIVEQMDIVEQTGYVDRKRIDSFVLAKAYRLCLVHGDPAQIPHDAR